MLLRRVLAQAFHVIRSCLSCLCRLYGEVRIPWLALVGRHLLVRCTCLMAAAVVWCLLRFTLIEEAYRLTEGAQEKGLPPYLA